MRASLARRARNCSPSRRPYRFVPRLEALENRLALNAHRRNLELVGELNLGAPNADVWGHEDFAYVGTSGNPFCLTNGVKIVDISDPSKPQWVASASGRSGTSSEDPMVVRLDTPFFQGDVLGIGIQRCVPVGQGAEGGLDLWDVTDPRNPVHLAFFGNGDGIGTGVHELYLFQRGDRAYALLAVPNAERQTIGFGEDRGLDFKLVDVTDPRHPVLVSQWGAFTSLGIRWDQGQGSDARSYLHSVSANEDGTTAFLSYWDTGMVLLDISDVSNPRYLGRTVYGPGEDGDAHSAIPARRDRIAIVTDEDWSPIGQGGFPGWGYARIFDISDPANPTQIGSFATPNSQTDRTDGRFSVHNPFIQGHTLYLSWYSDGIRVVNLSQPRRPQEIGSYVPPAYPDPFGVRPSPYVWGVWVGGDTILLSDTNFGLYVLRHGRGRGPEGDAGDSDAASPLVEAGLSTETVAVLLAAQRDDFPALPIAVAPAGPAWVTQPLWCSLWTGKEMGATPLPFAPRRVAPKVVPTVLVDRVLADFRDRLVAHALGEHVAAALE